MNIPNELRVFISSTFQDLQEEREHLIKKIFPEIRALCRSRGVTFTDIDLRWGITEEEAERESIIRICLDEIDRCRPYFIGILGQRHGWTPPRSDAERVADDYPILADAMLQGASITEMEMVHGVLANPAMAGHAFFYFRDRAATRAEFIDRDPDAISRLNDLKDRIRKSGFPVHEDFASPTELGAWLEEDLRRLVDTEYPQSEAPNALEVERRAHQAFAASRTRAYIPNPAYLKRFKAWVAETGITRSALEQEQERANDRSDSFLSLTSHDPTSSGSYPRLPLVVYGASGLGKSSLVAYLVNYYRSTHPTAIVIEHYVGASQTSGSATSVMRNIIEEIRERFALTEDIPTNPEELEASFANWLFRAEHHARQLGLAMFIAIDAVNQLDEAGRRLTWLPKTIPAGVRLLLSTTPGECAEGLAQRSWPALDVAPIDDELTREQIIGRYLGEFRKSITSKQMRRLTSDTKASSPLYLRVISEELRLHGEHETLESVIESYVSAADLLDVFDRVLARFEKDYGEATVQRLMSVLWASRSGLSELELMELAPLNRIELSRLLFAIDYHFLQREGLLGFFHDYLRRAVEKRYLPDEAKQQTIHLQIAEYFQFSVTASIAETGTAPLRMASELAYQLHAARAMERLAEWLSTMPVFLALYSGETQYEILGYWSAIDERIDVEGSYREGLERWGIEDAHERSAGLGRVADLLQRLGAWAGAIDLERERRSWAVEHGDRSEEAAARQSLGWLMQMRGDNAEAFSEFVQARDIFMETGDRRGISSANSNMGLVHFNRGEYDQALESFQHTLRISSELGDRRGVAVANSNMGLIYASRGAYDQALESFQRALSTCMELGDRSGVAQARGNMGPVYYSRGEYEQAIESYERQLNICMELGDRNGVSQAHGNMGVLYAGRRKYDRAIESYERQLSICTELGDRRGVSRAIGNMGNVFLRRGEYDRAIESYERKLSIAEELGDRRGICSAIGNMGLVYDRRGEYDRAIESYERQMSIYTELGNRSGIALAKGNMGGACASRMEYEQALEHLYHAADEHRAIGERGRLSGWLQRIADVLIAIVASAEEMPECLPTYIRRGTEGSERTWQDLTLQHAREVAAECIAISEELQMADVLFHGRLLVARIAAAEGGRAVALQRLTEMLETATDDAERAELHYRLWDLGEGGHATRALALYEALNTALPQHDYRKRIEEMKAVGDR